MTTKTAKVTRSNAKPAANAPAAPKAKKTAPTVSPFDQSIARCLEADSELRSREQPQSKTEIAALFAKDAARIERNATSILEFLIIAVVLSARALTRQDQLDLKRSLRAETQLAIKPVKSAIKGELNPHLAGGFDDDLVELRKFALNCLAKSARSHARYISQVCENLQKRGLLGEHSRSGDFAQFSYPEFDVTTRRENNPPGKRSKSQTVRRAVQKTVHRHSVVGVRYESLDELTVQPPTHVQELIAQVPKCIAPIVNVLQGDVYQVSETSEERHLESFSPLSQTVEDRHEVILDDPALVIGGLEGIGYVLTGWLENFEPPTGSPTVAEPSAMKAAMLTAFAAILGIATVLVTHFTPISMPVAFPITLGCLLGVTFWCVSSSEDRIAVLKRVIS